MTESTPASSFREWRQVSFQLSADLQHLGMVAHRWGRAEVVAAAQQQRQRSEEHRFSVAVVGDFKRGKSTFINALLGTEVLPADILPTTATVNRVTWGIRPTAELHFHDGRPVQTIPLDHLSEYVTKHTESSLAAAAAIREAVIQYPLRFCKNGVDIIDTPGLGDEATMTAVTMRVLPEVDAAIFVIMADSPFSSSEADFLEQLLGEGVTRVLYVVSAMDRIRKPADRERVLVSIRDRIEQRIRKRGEQRFGSETPAFQQWMEKHGRARVYGLSGRAALEAKLEGNGELLSGSGLPAFETELEELLTASDGLGLLRRVAQLQQLAEELAQKLEDSTGGIPTEDDLDFSRLEQLLRALDVGMEGQKRAFIEAAARALVGLEDPVSRWQPMVRSRMGQLIPRHILPENWRQVYPTFAQQVAMGVEEAIRQACVDLAEVLDQRLGTTLSTVPGAERLLFAAQGVLAHLERALERRGWSSSVATPAVEVNEPVQKASVEAMFRRISPGQELLMQALKDPGLVDALERQERKTGLDRLVSLDFYGPQGTWASNAVRQVDAVCAGHWAGSKIEDAVKWQVEELTRARMASLDPVAELISTARRSLLSFRERTVARAEQALLERRRDAARVREVAAKSRALQQRLEQHLHGG